MRAEPPNEMTDAYLLLAGKCVRVVRHTILEISPLWCHKKHRYLADTFVFVPSAWDFLMTILFLDEVR